MPAIHGQHEVRLFRLGRHPGAWAGPLHVDDHQGQLHLECQRDRLALEGDAGSAGAGDAEVAGERAPERTPTAAISSSTCRVRTPKFLWRASSSRIEEAGVIG